MNAVSILLCPVVNLWYTCLGTLRGLAQVVVVVVAAILGRPATRPEPRWIMVLTTDLGFVT